MAETKTTTSTRGRKPKTETVDINKELETKEEVKVENTNVVSQDEFNHTCGILKDYIEKAKTL